MNARRSIVSLATARRTVIVLDVAIVVASVFVAWILRARFPDMLFDLSRVLLFVPYVVGFRIFANGVLEHYRLSYENLHVADIGRLYIHQLLPTAFFLVLRLLSPIATLRMPLSMIAIEYVLSASGMSLARIIVVGRQIRRANALRVGRVPHGALIGHVARFGKQDLLPELDTPSWHLAGIISPDHLDSGIDFRGVRVFHGDPALQDLVLGDARVSFVALAPSLTRPECLHALRQAAKLGLRACVIDSTGLRSFSIEDLVSREYSDQGERLPTEVAEWVPTQAFSVCRLGGELSRSLEELLTAHGAQVAFASTSQDPELDPDTISIDLQLFELGERFMIQDSWPGSDGPPSLRRDALIPIQYPLASLLGPNYAESFYTLLTPNLATREALVLGVATHVYQSAWELASLVVKWAYHVARNGGGRWCYGEVPRPVTREELETLAAAQSDVMVRVADPPDLSVEHSEPTPYYRLLELEESAAVVDNRAT